MIILVKIVVLFTLIFFSYMFYLAWKERQKFFNSGEYESASLFEKIILNGVTIFGVLFFLLSFITYLIFMFSTVTISLMQI